MILVRNTSKVNPLVLQGIRNVNQGRYDRIAVKGLGQCTPTALLIADQIKARTFGLYK